MMKEYEVHMEVVFRKKVFVSAYNSQNAVVQALGRVNEDYPFSDEVVIMGVDEVGTTD